MHELEATILHFVVGRGADKSTCPSEIARAVDPRDWRRFMPAVRAEARALALVGKLRVTQGERTLDPEAEWHGPIRLRQPVVG